jgi:hypothetical protein
VVFDEESYLCMAIFSLALCGHMLCLSELVRSPDCMFDLGRVGKNGIFNVMMDKCGISTTRRRFDRMM